MATPIRVGMDIVGHTIVSTIGYPNNDDSVEYETAIVSTDYEYPSRVCNTIVVDGYETLEDAHNGHKAWIEKMYNPPKLLKSYNSNNKIVAKLKSKLDIFKVSLN